MSVALSVLVVIVASFAPLMTFLVDTRDPNVDTGAQLIEVRNTLYVIALFYPVWIWFTRLTETACRADELSFFPWPTGYLT
ncbi:hypothetical protein [Mycoplasma sp. ATU-Cv-508]|uniref:hypothetical protein n=1 Tax=Mycoplasma sp. ATU-Cv-508 TaxID=2048001 RepID=UPI000FDDB444